MDSHKTTFLKRKDSRSGIEPRSFRLPLGQTGSPYFVLPLSIINHTVSVDVKHHERRRRLHWPGSATEQGPAQSTNKRVNYHSKDATQTQHQRPQSPTVWPSPSMRGGTRDINSTRRYLWCSLCTSSGVYAPCIHLHAV